MPIVIKELFVSDQLSEALEKINFNFDQLLLAGGGPPGPQGPQGPQGVPGPEGDRGDHWFSGSTAPSIDHGPNYGQLQVNDHWIDDQGNVKYWNGSNWISSGINLTGPTGAKGDAGGSMEFGLWKGGINTYRNADYPPVGPSISTNWLPTGSVKLDVDTVGDVNFLIPVGIEKNVLFLGNQKWAKFNFNNFLGYDAQITGSYPENTPKLTIIQSKIGIDGFGGIAIGAYGMTSGTLTQNSQNLNILSGGWKPSLANQNSTVDDARNMFYAGISIQNFDSKLKHIFKSRTMSLDYYIQAGSSDSNLLNGNKPSVVISANLDINLLGISQAPADDNNSDLIRVNIGPKTNRFRNPSYLGFVSSDSNSISGNLSNIPSTVNLLVKNNSAILGNLYVGDTYSMSTSEYSINIGRNRKSKGTSSLSFFGRGGLTDINPILKIYSLTDNNLDDNSYISHTDSSSSLGKLYISATNNINLTASKKIEISSTSSTDIYSVFDSVNKRFGLGIASPLVTAHIKGGGELLRLEGSTSSRSIIKFYEDSIFKTEIGTSGTSGNNFVIKHNPDPNPSAITDANIILSTNNTNRVWVDWLGRVGIGGQSQNPKLYVYDYFNFTSGSSNNTLNRKVLYSGISVPNPSIDNLKNSSILILKTSSNYGSSQPGSSLSSDNSLLLGSYFTDILVPGLGGVSYPKVFNYGYIQSAPGNSFDTSILVLQPQGESILSIGKPGAVKPNSKVHIGTGATSIVKPEIIIEGKSSGTDRGKILFYPFGYNTVNYEDNNTFSNWKAYNGPGLNSEPSEGLALEGLVGSIGYSDSSTLKISSDYWYTRFNENYLINEISTSDLELSASGNISILGSYKILENPYLVDDNGNTYNARPTTLTNTPVFMFKPGFEELKSVPISGMNLGGWTSSGNAVREFTMPNQVGILSNIGEDFRHPVYIGGSIKILGNLLTIENAVDSPIYINANRDLIIKPGNDSSFKLLDHGTTKYFLQSDGQTNYIALTPQRPEFGSTPSDIYYNGAKSPLDISLDDLGITAGGRYHKGRSGSKYRAVKTNWRYLGSVPDYSHFVILLHPCAVGTGGGSNSPFPSETGDPVDMSFCIGDFYQLRGSSTSGNLFNRHKVHSQTAYNQNKGWVESYKTYDTMNGYADSPSDKIKSEYKPELSEVSTKESFLTIVKWGPNANSQEYWVAFYPGYVTQGHDIYFDGVYQNASNGLSDYIKIVVFETLTPGTAPKAFESSPGSGSQLYYPDIKANLFQKRFYSGVGHMTALSSSNQGQATNNYNHNDFVGSYASTYLRSVLYVDGLSFNQKSGLIREKTNAFNQKNGTLSNNLTGHIGGMDYLFVKIPAPLTFMSMRSVVDLKSEWPIYDSTTNDKFKIQVYNQVGINRIIVERPYFSDPYNGPQPYGNTNTGRGAHTVNIKIEFKNDYYGYTCIPELIFLGEDVPVANDKLIDYYAPETPVARTVQHTMVTDSNSGYPDLHVSHLYINVKLNPWSVVSGSTSSMQKYINYMVGSSVTADNAPALYLILRHTAFKTDY